MGNYVFVYSAQACIFTYPNGTGSALTRNPRDIVFVPNETKKRDLPPVIFQFIGRYHLIKYHPLS